MSETNKIFKIYRGNMAQLAEDLNVSKSTVYQWRSQGFVPEGSVVDVTMLPMVKKQKPKIEPMLLLTEAWMAKKLNSIK